MSDEVEMQETKFQCAVTTNFLIRDDAGVYHINHSGNFKLIGEAVINNKQRMLFESRKDYHPNTNHKEILKWFRDRCIEHIEANKESYPLIGDSSSIVII